MQRPMKNDTLNEEEKAIFLMKVKILTEKQEAQKSYVKVTTSLNKKDNEKLEMLCKGNKAEYIRNIIKKELEQH